MNELDSNTVFWNKFRQLLLGTTRAFLKSNSFPCWIELTSMATLDAGVRHLGSANETELKRRSYSHQQIAALALRLIQGRNADFFASLRPVWLAFGSSGKICDEVQCAIQTVNENWLSGISNEFGFSSAHAEFVLSMKRIGYDKGVLGKAIRESRICDETKHVGFPMVFERQSGIIAANRFLRDGFWVTPTKEEPKNPCKPIADAWGQLWETVYHVIGDKSKEPNRYLPSWLHQLSVKHPVRTLDSAGLGLAMQHLTSQANPNLPFGIGFTGRWQDERLGGVRGLQAKMEAAKEAGVFLLFACRDPDEAEPKPVAGLKVVMLTEGISLRDIVRKVNQVCADSGLTEYRWREAVHLFHIPPPTKSARSPDHPEAHAESLEITQNQKTPHSTDLPYAMERCWNGFVGRDTPLQLLRKASSNLDRTSGRRLVAITAPAGSGKTTLLSKYASERSPYPIWFSFRRGESTRQNLDQMQEAVRNQIAARFGSLTFSANWLDPKMSRPFSDKDLLQTVDGRIDIFVDGLDEIKSLDEQRSVLDWLLRLPVDGVVFVGTQPSPALDAVNHIPVELRNQSESGNADAEKMIAGFAEEFSKHEHLRYIAEKLQQDQWIHGIVKKTGGNPLILNEFFSAFLPVNGDGAAWPATPEELPLRDNVLEYGKTLLSTVLEDYKEETEKRLTEQFLAYLSFLGDRPWKVVDVVAIAGTALTSAPTCTWSGTGILKRSQRLVEVKGKYCCFCSPLTREVVRQNYSTDAGGVVRQFITYIQENSFHCDLLDHLIESVPSLLNEICEDGSTGSAPDLTCVLLFESPWLYLCCLSHVEKERSFGNLCAELQALSRFISVLEANAVRRVADWLLGWAWAITDEYETIGKRPRQPVGIEQWWEYGGEITKLFPRVENEDERNKNRVVLLAPITDGKSMEASYSDPWPATPKFRGEACELVDGENRYLVFVEGEYGDSSGRLLIYRELGSSFERVRRLQIDNADWIIDIASLKFPVLAAAIVQPNGAHELKYIDIQSGSTRVVKQFHSINAVASTTSEDPKLIVVYANEHDGWFRISVLNQAGTEENDFEIPLNDESRRKKRIVPIGESGFCLLAETYDPNRDPCEKFELWEYSLSDTSGQQLLENESIIGACSLLNGLFAVTYLDVCQSPRLKVFGDYDEQSKWIPLYERNGTFRDQIDGEFFKKCRPVGLHQDLGVILISNYNSSDVRCVRGKHESIPNALPREVLSATDPGDGNSTNNHVALSDGRILFVYTSGFVVIGPTESSVIRFEAGSLIVQGVKIVGCRADRRLLLSEGFFDPNGELHETLVYREFPFNQIGERHELVDLSSLITYDGWAVTVPNGQISARRDDSSTPLFWNANSFFESQGIIGDTIILDFKSRCPQDGLWITVKCGRKLFAIALQFGQEVYVLSFALVWQERLEETAALEILHISGNHLLLKCRSEAPLNVIREISRLPPIDNPQPPPILRLNWSEDVDPSRRVRGMHSSETLLVHHIEDGFSSGELDINFHLLPERSEWDEIKRRSFYAYANRSRERSGKYHGVTFHKGDWEDREIRILQLSENFSLLLLSSLKSHAYDLEYDGSRGQINFVTAQALIQRPGVAVEPIQGAFLSCETFLFNPYAAEPKSRIQIGSIVVSETEWSLTTYSLRIDDCNLTCECRDILPKVLLCKDHQNFVVDYDLSDKYLAIAYKSRRVEVRDRNDPSKIRAVGYVAEEPSQLALASWNKVDSELGDKELLIVVQGSNSISTFCLNELA